jgi:hypothetical protein
MSTSHESFGKNHVERLGIFFLDLLLPGVFQAQDPTGLVTR